MDPALLQSQFEALEPPEEPSGSTSPLPPR